MTLEEVLARHVQRAEHSVPDWMLGFWKRYSISFANGLTDLKTHVCWLQSRNFTIDLRLPLELKQTAAKPLANCSTDELQVLANYEGWVAESVWDGAMLSWLDTDTTLQLHNRWPEPAILKRVGNCMIEFCPSNAYVEDWRLQPSKPGPLIGLRLIEERELASGHVRHRGGGLIVCGDYAAMVLGRNEEVPGGKQLKAMVADAAGDVEVLQRLLNFETSVADGNISSGYRVRLSTRAARVGCDLCDLDGFEYLPALRQLRQCLRIDGIECERIFSIDTMETYLEFPQSTGFTSAAQTWFNQESPTLARYTEILRSVADCP
jgi:hypothetical protein